MDEERNVATETLTVAPATLNAAPVQKNVEYLPTERTMWTDPDLMKMSMQMAKALSDAPMVPNGYKKQPGNCLIAIDYGSRMGISPFEVMQNLDIIQGNAGWRGKAVIAMINNHGRFEPLKFSIEHNEDWSSFSAYAYAKERKTGDILRGPVVDDTMAKVSGWLDKNGSPWKKIPELMCVYRTATYFGRSYCPEALMGLYTSDELMDIDKSYEEKNIVRLEG